MPDTVPQFGLIDFVFLGTYMTIVLWIGFAVGRKEKSTVSDYFRAGNTLPWYAIGFSILAAGVSSEQFVGEVGYAYKLGLPVANWELAVFPALTLLMWIFVPLYVRNRVTTMPEYLEIRYGPRARTLYACLIIASYVFANFALVFYTGGYAVEKLWGVDKLTAVWVLAAATGAYTIYGGLASVAWTDLFQCVLLLGGGLYVFFAGMVRLGWDFGKVFSSPANSHLVNYSTPELPQPALVILALSTMTWYYANDQFINQRCLGAKNEWHAKMGVLLAAGLQLILPLAVCIPGMIYFTINPNLTDPNAAYPMMVMELVPAGLRGLIVAAVLGAIMSTISGLVNSTATMATLDIFARWPGKSWNEKQLVRFGQWSGGIALLIGALIAPAVMQWKDIFRYCQDIWSPMAAPAVVVFLGGALWRGGRERGAVTCLWMSIVSVPVVFLKQFLVDRGYHLPGYMLNLEDALIFSGALFMASIAVLVELSSTRKIWLSAMRALIWSALAFAVAAYSPMAIAILVAASVLGSVAVLGLRATAPSVSGWDRSMLHLPAGVSVRWYGNLWLWWSLVGLGFVAVYAYFW